jgi:hypothetical protein
MSFEEKGESGIVDSSKIIDSILLFEHIFSIFHSIVDAISETCDDSSNTVFIITILFQFVIFFLAYFQLMLKIKMEK